MYKTSTLAVCLFFSIYLFAEERVENIQLHELGSQTCFKSLRDTIKRGKQNEDLSKFLFESSKDDAVKREFFARVSKASPDDKLTLLEACVNAKVFREEVESYLVPLEEEPAYKLRCLIIRAMANPDKTVAALTELIRDDDDSALIIYTLGKIGAKSSSALTKLKEVSSKNKYVLSGIAAYAISRIEKDLKSDRSE